MRALSSRRYRSGRDTHLPPRSASISTLPLRAMSATVDAVFPFESLCAACQCARRAQLKHPARVLRGDEVQRAAQRPGANDRALGDGLFDWRSRLRAGAQADGPQRAEVVLRLDGAEPANGRGRAGERIMTDALLAHALGGESDGTSLGLGARKVYPQGAVLAWPREFCDCLFRGSGRTIPRLNTTRGPDLHVVDAVATGAEADQLRHPRDPEGHRAAGSHFVRGRPAVAGDVPGRAPAREGGRVLTDDPSPALQYGATEGYLPLREWIAARYSTPSVRIDPQNVLVTTGSQQGLDLLGKTLIDPGSRVLVETPTYLGALQSFSLFEPNFVSVTSDEDGLVPAALTPKLLDGARFLYVLPNFQNPTGPAHAARAPPGAARRSRSRRACCSRRRSVRRARLRGRCAADAAVDGARPDRAHRLVLEGARAGTARRLHHRARGPASQAGAGEAGHRPAHAEPHAAHRLRDREGRLPRHAHADHPRALPRPVQGDARGAERALPGRRRLERAGRAACSSG